MSDKKPSLLQRLKDEGKIKTPEGFQLLGEAGSGNDKVTVSDWDVSLSAEGALVTSCTITPVSTENHIWFMTIYATTAGTDKLAVLATAQPVDSEYLSENSVLLAGWTDLYNPSVDGNVIDSLINGYVKVGDNRVESFSFEKTFVL